MDEIKDDKDLSGLTPKEIEKRRRMIAWYKIHGFNDNLYGTKSIDKRHIK